MIFLEIEYRFSIFTRRAIGSAPVAWNELSEQQFIEISRLVNGKEIDFQFLSVMTSFSKRLIKALSPYQLTKLSDQIDFIGNNSKSHNYFFSSKLKETKLYSPKPKLAGMTFGQFIFADTYYNTWLMDKDDETLNKFIASLYLLRNEKFNEDTISEKKRLIENLPKDLRLSISFNYSLIISWLQHSYPLIFTSPVDQTDPKREVKIRLSNSGWLKIFESLVGEDLINRNKYAKLPLHTVFNYLTTKYKENARGHQSV